MNERLDNATEEHLRAVGISHVHVEGRDLFHELRDSNDRLIVRMIGFTELEGFVEGYLKGHEAGCEVMA